MAATTLSAILGFGRVVITAHYFGTRSELDAFLNASTIPTVLFDVFSSALIAALVPIFSEYKSMGRSDEVRRLGSTVINGLFLLMTGLAALGWLLAPLFVPVVAHGFPLSEQALVVHMVRWLMPGIVATSVSGVCAALLNANHRFLASALIWVATNVVTIVVVVVLHRELGIFALVLGTLLGVFAQLVVQFPSMIRHGLYSFDLDWRHPGLSKTWALILPLAVGSGVWQINVAFDRYFASTLSVGSTASLDYTTKVTFLPILIVAGPIATVIFPLIAGQFAISDRVAIRHSISLALRMVSFVVIPSAAGLVVLAYPIIQILFQRGAFGPTATTICANLIPFACVPLITTSYNSVLVRTCYACKQARFAVVGSSLAVVINIVLSATLLPSLGVRGLLLANGIAGFLLSLFLLALLWRLCNGFEWKPLLWLLLRVLLASSLMACSLYIFSLEYDRASTFASRALYLTGLVAGGTILFLLLARALGVGELSIAINTLTKRFARGTVAASKTFDPVP